MQKRDRIILRVRVIVAAVEFSMNLFVLHHKGFCLAICVEDCPEIAVLPEANGAIEHIAREVTLISCAIRTQGASTDVFPNSFRPPKQGRCDSTRNLILVRPEQV